MDDKIVIQLGEKQHINSVNIDNYTKLQLNNDVSELMEYNIRNILNVTEVFENERQNNETYRIYGGLEYISQLNNITALYKNLEDFFIPVFSGLTKNISGYDIYLVRPTTGYTNISGETIQYFTGLTGTTTFTPNTLLYVRKFEVIATSDDFKIFNAGYSNNLYGDQKYGFVFSKDFDITNYFDDFGIPITEFFLYFNYRKTTNGGGSSELLKQTQWNPTTGDKEIVDLDYQKFEIGDIIYGDLISYSKNYFNINNIESQTYYIRTPYTEISNNSFSIKYLQWKYNPFIELKLRYFDNNLYHDKLPQITPNSSSFNIYLKDNQDIYFNSIKKQSQALEEEEKAIIVWDSGNTYTGNTHFDWNKEKGELTFLSAGTYVINFETTLFLSKNKKFDGRTYLQKGFDDLFTNILESKRDYYNNQQNFETHRSVKIEMHFNKNEKIRASAERIVSNGDYLKSEIPYYATPVDDAGTFVWKKILPQGYIDPLTGNGVDYPFINKKRYLFSNIVLDVIPDLDDENTENVFTEIKFGDPTSLNYSPIGNINNFGKPCL